MEAPFTLTREQKAAVTALVRHGQSVTVCASPGAGKSTFFTAVVLEELRPGTFLETETSGEAKRLSDQSCGEGIRSLIVSYNTALKEETVRKLRDLSDRLQVPLSQRVEVMTFHGLVSHYSNEVISNDIEMRTKLEEWESSVSESSVSSATEEVKCNEVQNVPHLQLRKSRLDGIDLLLLDETQDMRLDYCLLVLFLLRERFTSSRLRVALVGDERQLLYSMYPINYADVRFLTMASVYVPRVTQKRLRFAATPFEFTESFRLQVSGTAFANALSKYPGNSPDTVARSPIRPLRSTAESWAPPPVHLVVCNLYSDLGKEDLDSDLDPVRVLLQLKAADELNETLLLFPSLNSRSVAKRVVQRATAAGILVRVEPSGDLAANTTVFNHEPDQTQMVFGTPPVTGSSTAYQAWVSAAALCKTFHSSKGLQFRNVLVFNTQNLLPLDNAFFVAATRHSHRLYVYQHAAKVSASEISYLQTAVGSATSAAAPKSGAEVAAEETQPLLQITLWKQPHKRHVESPVASASGSLVFKQTRLTKYVKTSVDAENLFRFMDPELLSRLFERVQLELEMAPTFPLDDMYRPTKQEGQTLRALISDSSSSAVQDLTAALAAASEADSSSFVKFCDQKGPGTVAVLGQVIRLALHCFVYGRLPKNLRDGYLAFSVSAATGGNRAAEEFRAQFETVRDLVAAVPGSGSGFWNRLRRIQRLAADFCGLYVAFSACQGFEDACVRTFDPACAIHATVFRRIELSALLVQAEVARFETELSSAERFPRCEEELQRWEEGFCTLPEGCGVRFLTSRAFWGGDRVVLLSCSLKTEIEELLEAVLTALVFNVEQALVLNVLDVSLTTVCLAPMNPASRSEEWESGSFDEREETTGDVSRSHEFMKEVMKAKRTEKVNLSDSEFLQRILTRVHVQCA
mmetsp:Transcript_4157/g.6472  ORF Transcript_4157/g.6472 Transcript_4157/m.6472 type:complete len:917 (+) Transcript_4157:180-2930(+)